MEDAWTSRKLNLRKKAVDHLCLEAANLVSMEVTEVTMVEGDKVVVIQWAKGLL